jgi:hypothetical protein
LVAVKHLVSALSSLAYLALAFPYPSLSPGTLHKGTTVIAEAILIFE